MCCCTYLYWKHCCSLCVYVCSMCPCVSSTGKMVGDRKKPCFSLGILPSYIGTHIKRLPSTKYAHHSTSREFIVETNMRAGTHIHIYTYTCTCTYTYIYIYTHIYIHTHLFSVEGNHRRIFPATSAASCTDARRSLRPPIPPIAAAT